jgi:hypothetical protein
VDPTTPLAVTATARPSDDAAPVAADRQWVCVACLARNALEADACAGCGRPFGSGLSLTPPPRPRRARAWGYVVRELVILNVLFILWRVVGRLSLLHGRGALGRGAAIWHAERVLHLPSEARLQRAVLGHATLDRVANGWYAYSHAVGLAAVLVWLLLRHREAYPRWRNLVVGVTAISLLVALLPVAPPRLVPATHLVDLAARFHQSVYDGLGNGITDQLSAMPSVHIAWAVIVAGAVIAVSDRRWRWLAVLYPLVTTYVVVVTANHYWLDALAGLAVVALVAFAGRRLWPALLP